MYCYAFVNQNYHAGFLFGPNFFSSRLGQGLLRCFKLSIARKILATSLSVSTPKTRQKPKIIQPANKAFAERIHCTFLHDYNKDRHSY